MNNNKIKNNRVLTVSIFIAFTFIEANLAHSATINYKYYFNKSLEFPYVTNNFITGTFSYDDKPVEIGGNLFELTDFTLDFNRLRTFTEKPIKLTLSDAVQPSNLKFNSFSQELQGVFSVQKTSYICRDMESCFCSDRINANINFGNNNSRQETAGGFYYDEIFGCRYGQGIGQPLSSVSYEQVKAVPEPSFTLGFGIFTLGFLFKKKANSRYIKRS